jgi:hypothetical protein
MNVLTPFLRTRTLSRSFETLLGRIQSQLSRWHCKRELTMEGGAPGLSTGVPEMWMPSEPSSPSIVGVNIVS